uniref:Uncharacterized protein n=1 Tax=viral metagenome TaxID=1070528 RepID=A0A6C0IQL5_9ZZZZ
MATIVNTNDIKVESIEFDKDSNLKASFQIDGEIFNIEIAGEEVKKIVPDVVSPVETTPTTILPGPSDTIPIEEEEEEQKEEQEEEQKEEQEEEQKESTGIPIDTTFEQKYDIVDSVKKSLMPFLEGNAELNKKIYGIEGEVDDTIKHLLTGQLYSELTKRSEELENGMSGGDDTPAAGDVPNNIEEANENLTKAKNALADAKNADITDEEEINKAEQSVKQYEVELENVRQKNLEIELSDSDTEEEVHDSDSDSEEEEYKDDFEQESTKEDTVTKPAAEAAPAPEAEAAPAPEAEAAPAPEAEAAPAPEAEAAPMAAAVTAPVANTDMKDAPLDVNAAEAEPAPEPADEANIEAADIEAAPVAEPDTEPATDSTPVEPNDKQILQDVLTTIRKRKSSALGFRKPQEKMGAKIYDLVYFIIQTMTLDTFNKYISKYDKKTNDYNAVIDKLKPQITKIEKRPNFNSASEKYITLKKQEDEANNRYYVFLKDFEEHLRKHILEKPMFENVQDEDAFEDSADMIINLHTFVSNKFNEIDGIRVSHTASNKARVSAAASRTKGKSKSIGRALVRAPGEGLRSFGRYAGFGGKTHKKRSGRGSRTTRKHQ